MTNLDQYSKQLQKLEAFEAKNIIYTTQLKEIKDTLEVLKEQAKDEVRMGKDDITSTDGTVFARRSETYKKWYDYIAFTKYATKKEKEDLDFFGGAKTEIDKTIFNGMIKDETISKQTAQQCFQEEMRSISVSLIRKDGDE